MFSRKNKNLPNKEYPASASEPRTRSKSHLSAMSGVYAGPDAMSNRVPMDTVYAGPDEMSARTPMAPVYAGPDEMNGRVPSGAFTDPRFNIAPPLPKNLNQPIAMMVYAGPEQMSNFRAINMTNPNAPFAAQSQESYVDDNTPATVCKVCGARIPLTCKFCYGCGSINENRPTQA